MRFTVFEQATGRIKKTVTCSSEVDAAAQCAAGDAYISGFFPDDKFYVQGTTAAPIPNKPSDSHIFDYTTKQWVDPRSLQEHKDAKWAEIKSVRTNNEYGPFTWDGSVFDGDAVSQQKISGAVLMAVMSPSYTVDWTLFDNTVRTLTAADVLQLGAALGAHIGAVYEHARQLRASIEAAQTSEEVAAISW